MYAAIAKISNSSNGDPRGPHRDLNLEVQCSLVYSQSCFAQRFGQGRVSMTNACNVFCGTLEFHDRYGLGDELGDLRSHHVHYQNLISFGGSRYLDKANQLAQRTGTPVGHKGERTTTVFATRFFELFLGLTHPSYLWVGVNHPWNGIEID